MNMGLYGRYVYYFDRHQKRVMEAGTIIRTTGHQPHKNPRRYRRLGEWYAHENKPFYDGHRVVRMRYGKKISV